MFSFNAPLGACPTCNGLGITQSVDIDLLIPDKNLSIAEGGIRYYKNIVNTQNIEWQTFSKLCDYAKVDINKPIKKLTKRQMDLILYGTDKPVEYTIHTRSGNMMRKHEVIEGVVTMIERRHRETSSSHAREWYGSFLSESFCETCKGTSLNEYALSVYVNDKIYLNLRKMSIDKAHDFVTNLQLSKMKKRSLN